MIRMCIHYYQIHLFSFDTCIINDIKSNVIKCVLFLVVSQMFFVSGPVVVSPSKTITFQTYLPIKYFSRTKWLKMKDQSTKEIKLDKEKYLYTQGDHMHTFKITNAKTEDSATYYFSLEDMSSNNISVHVDGKYIYIYFQRYFCAVK